MHIILLSVLLAVQSFAAISAATVWELRTLGSATNSGGFVAGATGTDRSQSNTAFCTASDLVLVSTTTATSATCPFSAASVGNLIQIPTGTANCTAGFYQVVSVASVTATLDRVAGTVACVTGTFSLGGAIVSPVVFGANQVSGNTAYLKADGTYTAVAQTTINNTSSTSTGSKLIGYTTTRGDNGRATWTTATNSVTLIFSDTGAGLSLSNLSMSSTAATRGNGISVDFQTFGLVVYNCLLDGFNLGIVSQRQIVTAEIIGTEIKNSVSHGLSMSQTNQGGSLYVRGSYLHNNGGHGILFTQTSAIFTLIDSVASKNGIDGVHVTSTASQPGNQAIAMDGDVLSENSGDGFEFDDAGSIEHPIITSANTIYYGNTGTGLKSSQIPSFQLSLSSAFGANGTARSNFSAGTTDVTLTADPFVSKATGNYALNSTVGGGVLLKAVGYPGVSLFGTGYLDIGVIQTQGSVAAPQRNTGTIQ